MSAFTTGGAPVVLDGGLATELQRAGLPYQPPWWGTAALLADSRRRVLRDVHERFLTAGAQVLTANTLRCNLRALRRAGLEDAGLGWMVHAAVGVALAARNAAGAPGTRIAASMAPVEDCYRPDLVPADDELREEHRWLAVELVRAGVELVLVETMNTAREARIAVEQVREVGALAWASFVCDDQGRLLSGDSLVDAARAVRAAGAEVVLVNCTGPEATERCLRALRDADDGPIGAYPNLEDRRDGAPGPRPLLDPAEFGDLVAGWAVEYRLAVTGGCCGASPAHIAALTARLNAPVAAVD
ncbi:homocysteine S-methyltransferase family protein [Micromonospora chalcea]|uniref:homocysteine S-methyltransferase family protein n=1 Tax=Micromonospora chalcea TaxID=1874 RepID=UPI0037BCC802